MAKLGDSFYKSGDPGDQPDPYADLVRQNLLNMGPGASPSTGPMTVSNPPGGAPQPGGTDLPPAPPSPFSDVVTNAPPYTPGQPGSYQPGSPNDPANQASITGPPKDAGPPPPPVPQTNLPPATAPPPAPSPNVTATTGGGGYQSNTVPPEIASLLDQLRQGLASFQAPQVQVQPQATPAYGDAIRSAIMDALAQGQRPVDPNDPLVAPMLSAMQVQGQRAKDQNAAQQAEQLSAQHLLSSGAYNTATERYNQGIDEATSGQTAQLMTQVLTDRQNRLMQALQLGANYLNADQARQLQAELANVNSALQVYGVKATAGLGVLESLLRNQQFYDQLGTQAGEFAQNQNNNFAVG